MFLNTWLFSLPQSRYSFCLFALSAVSLFCCPSCIFWFSHQQNMLAVRLRVGNKTPHTHIHKDTYPAAPENHCLLVLSPPPPSLQGLRRVIMKVTWLRFWPRICGLGSQQGEILISQKYVKERTRQGREKKKITCREHEYQGRHA